MIVRILLATYKGHCVVMIQVLLVAFRRLDSISQSEGNRAKDGGNSGEDADASSRARIFIRRRGRAAAS